LRGARFDDEKGAARQVLSAFGRAFIKQRKGRILRPGEWEGILGKEKNHGTSCPHVIGIETNRGI